MLTQTALYPNTTPFSAINVLQLRYLPEYGTQTAVFIEPRAYPRTVAETERTALLFAGSDGRLGKPEMPYGKLFRPDRYNILSFPAAD